MRRIVAVIAALLPLAAVAADKFTMVSAEVKPNVRIAERRFTRASGAAAATSHRRSPGAIRRRAPRASR